MRGGKVSPLGSTDQGLVDPSSAMGGAEEAFRLLAESVKDFFDGLASRVDPAKTTGMTNSYVFDIEGAGAWTVAIADGKVTVSEGAGEADCTISTSEESFEKIMSGEQNATTAYMTGKLKIKGDMGAAMKLQKLF